MSSFTVPCICGERFHADDASIGRRVRCRCGRTVELQPPPSVVSAREKPSSRSAGGKTLRRIQRALGYLAWSYIAAIVAVAAVMWGLGDRWWPATVLLFMGRWVVLLPLAVLIPASLALRRRLLVPLSLGALIALGPVMGARAGWGRLFVPSGGMPLRVVTFNADGGQFISYGLAERLQEWSADVVLFQECGEQLATAVDHVPGWHSHHVYGLCTLTRLPIIAAEVMDRGALAQVHQDQTAAIGGAGYVVRYTLATAKGPIEVTNLHLETPRKGFEGFMAGDVQQLRLNTTLRDLESELARRWVDAGRAPTIVAGDFNTPVESRIFQEHWGDLADAFSRVGFGFGTSKYNGWIRIRIDHVLTDDAWRARRVQVLPDLGSDHRAVVADLVLVKP